MDWRINPTASEAALRAATDAIGNTVKQMRAVGDPLSLGSTGVQLLVPQSVAWSMQKLGALRFLVLRVVKWCSEPSKDLLGRGFLLLLALPEIAWARAMQSVAANELRFSLEDIRGVGAIGSSEFGEKRRRGVVRSKTE